MKFARRVAQLKTSVTLAVTSKAKELRKIGIDVIDFGAGEPDFDTPANIRSAAINAIESGFTKYTPASGIRELKEAVCGKFKRDNSLNYKPEEVVISCGAKHAIYNILQVLCDTGDEVIIVSPYWLSYVAMVELSGARPRIARADEKDGFVVDPKLIEKAVTKRTKAIIVNSPSNPTGAVFGKSVLEKISKIALSKNIFVISDEIYEKLIYDGEKHVSIGALNSAIFKKTITVNGVSKTYSMTGWRIGYAAGPAEIMKMAANLQSHSTSNPASISQMAALEALRGPQAAVGDMRREFASRRDYMVKAINSFPKVSCAVPKGAFYVFPNIAKTKIDSLTLTERLLEEAHVACVPGRPFGSDKHIRLSFATSIENIENGLARIKTWLERG